MRERYINLRRLIPSASRSVIAPLLGIAVGSVASATLDQQYPISFVFETIELKKRPVQCNHELSSAVRFGVVDFNDALPMLFSPCRG